MEALEICKRPVVLFDFDGTVADTGRAVMTSTRKTLAARGFSEAQMGDLRRMIGPPLWKSFHDFYGFSREESLVVADEYRAFFDELGPEEYPVFDGIPELLDGLAAQGHRMAVATSRMEVKCIDMVHELGLSQFEAVVGMNPPQGRETKADSVRDALAALGATADEAVMIGDRFNDVEGAHAMGVPCIGISSGAAAPGEHEFVKFLAFVHADAYGRGLGIDATSPAFGPLTCNPGVIRVVDGHIEQVIDVRFPDSTSADTISEQLEPLVGRFDVTCRLGHAKVPFSVSADDPAVKALIDTYNEFTGKHAEPFAMGGGTYARNFARAVSFGPEETGLELPAWGGQMHGPNECANEEQLKQALKIYIVAILRLNELEL